MQATSARGLHKRHVLWGTRELMNIGAIGSASSLLLNSLAKTRGDAHADPARLGFGTEWGGDCETLSLRRLDLEPRVSHYRLSGPRRIAAVSIVFVHAN